MARSRRRNGRCEFSALLFFQQPVSCNVANNFHRSAIRSEFVRHDDMWVPVPFHCFPEEFQRRFAISALCNKCLQHLTFVIHGSPKIVRLAVDLHENFVQMPLPVRISPHSADPLSAALCCKHRAKSVPPIPDRFVADVDAAFVQKIFDIPQREWKPDLQRNRQANDLGTAVKVLEWVALFHE